VSVDVPLDEVASGMDGRREHVVPALRLELLEQLLEGGRALAELVLAELLDRLGIRILRFATCCGPPVRDLSTTRNRTSFPGLAVRFSPTGTYLPFFLTSTSVIRRTLRACSTQPPI
jgi:hypothetical protein